MALPNAPLTLSPEQVEELDRKLADLRHDVNNQLSLMNAAIELLRRQPQNADRFIRSLADQPAKTQQAAARFLGELEAAVRLQQT